MGCFLFAVSVLAVAYALILVAELTSGPFNPALILAVGGANLLMLALFLVSAVFVPVCVQRAMRYLDAARAFA